MSTCLKERQPAGEKNDELVQVLASLRICSIFSASNDFVYKPLTATRAAGMFMRTPTSPKVAVLLPELCVTRDPCNQ